MNKGITSEMLKLPAKQPDLQELYHNIWQFREAAFLCMKPQRMSFGIVKGLWVPSMVLLAFACELELKYIYISETGKTINKHALSQLFEQLSEGQKNEIKKQFNPEDEFEVNIKEFENVFITWRYKYEYTPINSIDYRFLRKFDSILYEIVNKLCEK